MTWRASCPMDERMNFIAEIERGVRSVSEICRLFGVSRKTGYKWIARFEQDGAEGLKSHSRAALVHPNAVDTQLVAMLLATRRRHDDWGPQKLLAYLGTRHPQRHWPAISTVAQLLNRHGLVKARKPRSRSAPYSAPFVRANAPNALWSADFKGQFRTGDGHYCYPLTISDGFSRYLISCRGLLHPSQALTQPWFERAFRDFGLPAVIRTDNGAPFASTGVGGLSKLSIWWLKLGIVPERIRLGHPEQNGRHERMHRTLKRRCAVKTHLQAQQRAFNRFRVEYNQERPHRALADRTPAMLYQPSHRELPGKVPRFEYSSDCAVRRVHPNGEITWHAQPYYLGQVLAGEEVGFYPIADGRWRILVGTLAVAELDIKAQTIVSIDVHIDVPTLH